MNTERLQYFIEAYKTRSLYQAADNIGITHQGLSHSIKQLEGQLRIKLFLRSSNGIVPTEFADELYPKAIEMLELEEGIDKMALNYRRRINGSIKFGLLGKNLFSHMVEAAIQDFGAANGDIEVSVVEFDADDPEAVFAAVRNGDIDVAWMFHRVVSEEFEYHTVRSARNGLIVGPNSPLYECDKVEWRQIEPYRLILPGRNDSYTQVVKFFLENLGVDVDSMHCTYSTDIFTIKQLLEETNAAMAVNEFYYSNLRSMCPSVRLIEAEPNMTVSISFFHKAGRKLTEAQHAVLDYLMTLFKDNVKSF